MEEKKTIKQPLGRSITILTVGSRGDVQPYCALAVGLQRAGHRVRVATHHNFSELVNRCGLEFAPIAGNFKELLESDEGQKLLEGQLGNLLSDDLLQAQLADAWQACQDSDVIILTPLANWGYSIAERLAVPCFFASSIPLSPTCAFPFLKFAKRSTNHFTGTLNYISYFVVEFLFWQLQRKKINEFRKQVLNLPPVPPGGVRFRIRRPKNLSPLRTLYGFSPSVIPKPNDWPSWLHVTGYWFLDQEQDYQPPSELLDFLDNGPAPICVGFGSMITRNPRLLAEIVIEALARSNRRGILLSGWAGIGNVELPDSIFACNFVPHDWLFPRMAAIVHHGGAGTTAAGLRAGVPSVIVPFIIGDQQAWGERVSDLGVGPAPIPYKKLTAERLAFAIQVAVGDQAIRERAVALGQKIREEDGVVNAVDVFHRHLAECTPEKDSAGFSYKHFG